MSDDAANKAIEEITSSKVYNEERVDPMDSHTADN